MDNFNHKLFHLLSVKNMVETGVSILKILRSVGPIIILDHSSDDVTP